MTRSYDAEVLRAALARTFTRTREILIAHGATVEKFIGDAVMAVFGVPVAHEDDAERAVRAAIALRAEVSSSGEGRPRFSLRIGINTGEVVTGDVEGAEFLVTGGPVIVAARLEENAQPGEILVGPMSREITRDRIQYDTPRLIEAKGMGQVEAAAALEVLGAVLPGALPHLGPFVGRDSELRLLGEIHARVASTGRPHLVTVYGEAGIGKSRVAMEFLRRLDPNEPMARATCLPYGHAITYGPLQELIRGEAAIAATDARDTARSKIETRVAGMAGLDTRETETLARDLLGEGAASRVEEIVERTEGNPLFVEEFVHMLLDQGSKAVVPPTLHGVIAARLDATSPSVKRLIQEASVVGRTFWLDALPSTPSTRDVDEAERRGLISQRARRGPTGTHTFVFRHGLIRDVAYGSLSKAERIQVHDHYSRWLETAAGERAQEYAEIVAYHAERAFELARELDAPAASELGRRALAELSRTAAAASARGEFRAARALHDRALRVAETASIPMPDQAASRTLAAIVSLRLDSDTAAVNELDRAITAARALGPSTELVRLLVWRASSVTIFDDLDESERLFEEAVALARQTGDREILAYAVWASSEPLGLTGQLEKQASLLNDALAQIRATAAPYEIACLAEICVNAIRRGDKKRARQIADEAIASAQTTGRRMDRWRAAWALAASLLANGDPEALSAAEEAFALAREIGGPGALM